jgi:hypothetical protein
LHWARLAYARFAFLSGTSQLNPQEPRYEKCFFLSMPLIYIEAGAYAQGGQFFDIFSGMQANEAPSGVAYV